MTTAKTTTTLRQRMIQDLQHVLPSGFQKVRHDGFLGSPSPLSVEAVRWLVTTYNGGLFLLLAQAAPQPRAKPAPRCAECGGALQMVAYIPRRAPTFFDTS